MNKKIVYSFRFSSLFHIFLSDDETKQCVKVSSTERGVWIFNELSCEAVYDWLFVAKQRAVTF